jgi:hypothetical protein
MDTTVVVPPGWAVESDPVGILELRRTAAPAPPQTTTGAVGAAN